jgi:RNA polymerase sigma factor (sigma-70 family)
MKRWNDEAELIARCKRELPYKHASFEILVNRYKDLILTLCYRLVGRRSIAEELMQEVLMKVFANLEKFEERSKFSSWVYRIAHNHCLEDSRTDNNEEKAGGFKDSFAFLSLQVKKKIKTNSQSRCIFREFPSFLGKV